MKFCVITPCRNAETLIYETVESIVGQSAFRQKTAELQYILADGASSDGTVKIVEELVSKAGIHLDLTILSREDDGMYDALASALELVDADYVSYLNAGDYYSPHAVGVVGDVFSKNSVQWLTGMEVSYNAHGHVTHAHIPAVYRTRLLKKGFYGYRGRLGNVQQESTFWTSDLLHLIDAERLRSFQLAGDFYIWSRFIECAPLYTVTSYLGGYKNHANRLSEDMAGYRREMRPLLTAPGPSDYLLAAFDRLATRLPMRMRRSLAQGKMISWHEHLDSWTAE